MEKEQEKQPAGHETGWKCEFKGDAHLLPQKDEIPWIALRKVTCVIDCIVFASVIVLLADVILYVYWLAWDIKATKTECLVCLVSFTISATNIAMLKDEVLLINKRDKL